MLNSPEFRLAFLLLLNAVVLIAAYRAARAWTTDAVQRAIDTLLLWYVIQYASVCVPGLLHALSAWTMSATAIFLSASLIFLGRPRSTGVPPVVLPSPGTPGEGQGGGSFARIPRETIVLLAAFTFSAAFVAAVIYQQNTLPLIDSDAMTYHVPAALHWLRTGRLSLFPVWFFNPANSFSPLAGSTFIAWLFAPLNDDVLARAVQAPALMLLFFATVRIAKSLGCSMLVAALVAAAVVISRPFISETIAARDDVFLTAFIAVAVAGCAPDSMHDRFAPWRLGLAVGLAAATKYTFAFSLPILLLLIDAPFKAGWSKRRWLIAVAVALLVAAPWYLRNLILTGNPLYPLKIAGLPGILQTLRTDRFNSWEGAKHVLITTFHGPTLSLWIILLLGWLGAALAGRQVWRNPVLRAIVFGFPICLALFLSKTPYGEIRFLFPAILLLFPAVGVSATGRRTRRPVPLTEPKSTGLGVPRPAAPIAATISTILLLLSIRSSFKNLEILAQLTITAVIATALVVGYAHLESRAVPEHRLRLRSYVAGVVILILGSLTYVYWDSYLKTYHQIAGGIKDSEELPGGFWSAHYPALGPAWTFVRDNVPPDATIAYANTYLTYPLYGTPPTRKVIYVPIRDDVPDFLHLPKFPSPLPGESIAQAFTQLLDQNADQTAWLKRLMESKADYLFIARVESVLNPPELRFAESDPAHFQSIFDSDHAAVFKILRQ